MYQRSADIGLGLPFNIASYAFLTHLLAKHCGLECGELIIFIGNAHIYEEHVKALGEQVSRPIQPPPRLEIQRRANSISEYTEKDFIVSDYNHGRKVSMRLIA
jgi:thymidylate synthase